MNRLLMFVQNPMANPCPISQRWCITYLEPCLEGWSSLVLFFCSNGNRWWGYCSWGPWFYIQAQGRRHGKGITTQTSYWAICPGTGFQVIITTHYTDKQLSWSLPWKVIQPGWLWCVCEISYAVSSSLLAVKCLNLNLPLVLHPNAEQFN